ncbi:MAG: CHAT domain-containing tetratricopeptide repeat protein [Acidobacteriota bacterium]
MSRTGARIIVAVILAALVPATLLPGPGAPLKADPDAPAPSTAELLDQAEDLLIASGAGLARTVAEEALERARAAGDGRLEVAALARLAAALDEQGEREAAEARYAEATRRSAELGDPVGESIVLIERGHAAWKRPDYATASERGERALVLAEQAGDRVQQAAALRLLGRIAVKRGDYDAAIARAGRAAALSELAGDRRGTALAHEDIAFANLDRRFLAMALDHYHAALGTYEELGSASGKTRVLCNVTVVFLIQGSGDDALAAAERAVAAAAEPGGDPASLAWGRYLRAQALRSLDRHEEARSELQKVLAARREQRDPRGEAWILARLGQLAAELDRPAEALLRYREALAIWRRLEDWRASAWFLLEAARASVNVGEPQRARELFHAAIEVAERIDLPYRSMALGGLARLEASGGERESALLDGHRAVDAARATENLEMIWNAYYDLAEVEITFDMRREALDHLRAALAAIEKLRAEGVPTDRSKRAEIAGRQAVYSRAVGLLVDSGLVIEALEVAERARARASLDLFASTAEASDPAIAAAIGAEAADATPSPRHVEVPPAALLIGEVRQRGATAVEYFVGDGRLFAWVIGPDGALHVATSPLAPARLEQLVGDLRREVQPEPGKPIPADPDAALRATLRDLDRLLVEPVARWLPSDPERVVTIVPHDRLFLVSFASLLDASGKYLVERHALSYVPALSILAWTGRERGRAEASGPVLVVGNPEMPAVPGRARPLDPLPGAEQEARAVAKALGGGAAVMLTGRQAVEPEVRRLAAGAPVLHLATHALMRDDRPQESCVVLAPSEGPNATSDPAARDGRWTMTEIQSSRLVADLVTLSACESGVGRLSGDGVLGFQRALLVAGARSALVSLWRVADVVAQFQMERFYRELASGGDRTRALRSAQLATLAALRAGALRTPSGHPIHESPLYWAPFVLVGEPR